MVCALALLGAAGAVSVAVAGSPGANRRAARGDARTLLGRLNLPPGAQSVSREPAGDGGFLRPMPGLMGSPAQAVADGWWKAAAAPADVLAYVQAHPPAGGRVQATGSAGNRHTGQTSQMITYAWPAIPGVISQRELQITVTALPAGGTGVLVEAASVWVVPRPRGERIPAGVRAIDVTVAPLLTPRRPVAAYHVTGGRVGRIDRRLNRLPVVQPLAIVCPAELADGARLVTLTFRGGTVLARARFTAYPGWGTASGECNPISLTIGGRRRTPLLGGHFFTWLGRMLHTRFAAAAG